jgi:hypothetical protein
MSTAKFNTWLNPNGTENYKCRAWVNFDGTTTVPTIRASGNVSSVTRNSTGDYTVNFTTALPDANYSISSICSLTSTANQTGVFWAGSVATASSARVLVYSTTTTFYDEAFVAVTIFR